MRMRRLFVREQQHLQEFICDCVCVCFTVFRVVWLLCSLFGWLVFSLSWCWWIFCWFVLLSVSLCGYEFGLFASQCGFLCVCVCVESVCVLGILCWLTWGRVYRAGPSRAQISDPHIPEPPLIASVCCSL